MTGQYDIPTVYSHVTGVVTNKARVDAYRGVTETPMLMMLERLVDTVAKEAGMDPAAVRRRNFVEPDQFPYESASGAVYDSGDYERNFDLGLETVGYEQLRERQTELRADGRYLGIGLSCWVEGAALGPCGELDIATWGYGSVQVHPTGEVTVRSGGSNHGQGHETTFAQIVSDRLGIPFDDVDVVHGDTDRSAFGMGTYGSRSLAVGGSAIVKAMDKIIDKSRRIAAHMLEAAEADIEYDDGTFRVAGTDKSLSMAEVAFSAYVPHNYPLEQLEPGLDESAFYDPTNFTYPAGSHICEVEVDPDTGRVEIVNFTAVDDFGNVINPMIVEGQVHGGLAQGIGQALLEGAVYDAESGQLITGTYMDYTMPRADDLPSFRVDTCNTPCTHNPLGVKGCGEAGAIGSPPAVIDAIIDALRPLGVTDLEMPATPLRVWQAIQDAQGRQVA